MNYVPLQLKIKSFSSKIHRLKNYITLMSIESDDKELFKKFREIWNRIIKITGKNFVMVDVHANTSFVENIYRDKLVIVLHSIVDNHLKASLAQLKIISI